jgi:hypothetical protein
MYSTGRKHFLVIYSFMTYHRVCNEINTTGATSRAGTAYPSGAPEFTPGFWWGSCYSIFSLMCMFCKSLFVFLYFILLALVLSVFLQFTDSDYSFRIFKLFLTMYMCAIRRVSYKKNSLLTLREHLTSPAIFCRIHVAHLFIFQCYFVFCLSSLCVLYAQCCQCRWIVY